MRAPVAVDEGLPDLRLDGQHALDALRRDVVAAGIDDDVLLPVGNSDVALRVDLADVAGAQPAVDDRARRRLRIGPVASHDQLAASHDFAILGATHLHACEPHIRPASRRESLMYAVY